MPVHRHRKTELRHIDHCPGAIDHPAHRRLLPADNLRVGHHRAQPMEEIQDPLARHAREQVLVAARKAHHLVRIHRPHDDQPIVLEHQPVHLDRHLHLEQPPRQLADLPGAQDADRLQRARVVPCVVVELHAAVDPAALLGRDLEPLADGLLAHRLVRPQRDQDVHLPGHRSEPRVQRLEHRPHRRRARPVRDDEQDLLAAIAGLGTCPSHHLGHVVRAQGNTAGGRPLCCQIGCGHKPLRWFAPETRRPPGYRPPSRSCSPSSWPGKGPPPAAPAPPQIAPSACGSRPPGSARSASRPR